ncbi:MAG TPA: carboxypeptidase-like regulatory domain-containing protein [Candidatus Angelobacter sp.]|nr:carboxypeptidase-like regulatory domain-containing protein [Candidatus Angelobacter sp.]
MMSIGVAFGKNHSQQSPNQQAANRQAKAGVWIMVLDPQGALVPGAEVRLIDIIGKQVAARTSGSDPLFFPPLPNGNYLLVIRATGFSDFSQHVVLKQDKLEDLKAKLTVSEASMGILIESDEPLVQTEASVSTTFERRTLDVPFRPVAQGAGHRLFGNRANIFSAHTRTLIDACHRPSRAMKLKHSASIYRQCAQGELKFGNRLVQFRMYCAELFTQRRQ